MKKQLEYWRSLTKFEKFVVIVVMIKSTIITIEWIGG